MRVTRTFAERNTEEMLAAEIRAGTDASVGIIHVRTRDEVYRAVNTLRLVLTTGGGTYHEWDIVNGTREFTPVDIEEELKPGDGMMDFVAALTEVGNSNKVTDIGGGNEFFVFVNPQPFLDNNPMVYQLFHRYSRVLPTTNITIILVTPDVGLPDQYNELLRVISLERPSLAELSRVYDMVKDTVYVEGESFNLLGSFEDDHRDRLLNAAAGLTCDRFEQLLSVAIVTSSRLENRMVDPEEVINAVAHGKTEIINENEMLELFQPEDMSQVGGMENLKAWVRKRRNCYSDEAAEFGITPPKGAVFVGPPGTGKSLVAKAIASELGVRPIRFNMSAVFSKYVGDTEGRMRSALGLVQAVAPVVLFIDEIDKAMSGTGGSGDSGVASRALGILLTFLQENESPIFVFATANDISGLPPELFRVGRFDKTFASGLPNKRERREILKIHLKKRRNRDIDELDQDDIENVLDAMAGFVGSEVEGAVAESLINAFDEGEEVTANHILAATQTFKPISVAFADRIREMTAWAEQNATPAGLTESATASRQPRQVRVSRRSRQVQTKDSGGGAKH